MVCSTSGVLSYYERKNDNHICRESDCQEASMNRKNKYNTAESIDVTFGNILRNIMAKKGVEVRELSGITGISIPSIYRYLNDERICSLEHTAAICIAMALEPMQSKHLFTLTRSHLCCTDKRDRIVAKYIHCCYDKRYTLRKCNQELIYEGYEPLTSIGTYKELIDS